MAQGAGVRGTLPSPTFNLVFRYPLAEGASVIHADLYRIGSPGELDGIGWEDLVSDEAAIVLVEWPERAGDRLPEDRWDVTLEYAEAPGLRRVTAVQRGDSPSVPEMIVGA